MKIILIALFILYGQGSLKDPPEKVLKAFKQKFPSAIDVNWIEEENKVHVTSNFDGKIYKYVDDHENTWTANFMYGGRKTSATFDLEGHWQRSQQEINWDDIGVKEVREAIKKDFYETYKNRVILIYNDVVVGTYYNVSGIYYDWIGNSWPPKM
jgi:tRNA U38,U39,U40 pseudouridine synthase TruA